MNEINNGQLVGASIVAFSAVLFLIFNSWFFLGAMFVGLCVYLMYAFIFKK